MNLKLLITLVALCASHAIYSQVQIDSNKLVRVLSFNILHGKTMNEDFDMDRIAKVIIDANPDFVAMQEVDYKVNRSMNLDLVTEIGWRTKMLPVFARAMSYDGGEYGEGVLSRYPFLQSRNVPLPFRPGSEPRAALEIITVLPSGDTIAFIGTHLDHLEEEDDRISQAKQINKAFSSNKYPTILAGDLNAIPGSTPINILEEMWSASYDVNKPEPTYPSNKPVKKIDYVMFYPGTMWRVLETEVIQDSIASDHCAYLVSLILLNE